MTIDGGVGTHGGNVRSVDEARQLQTASKPLDRWRLIMEQQIHRTLLATGYFHIDDLDCLDLPAEAFQVRGTLVNSVRRTGVMRKTDVYRKVSHKAANGRPAPVYELTAEGRTELTQLVGSGGNDASSSGGASQVGAAAPGQNPFAGHDTREAGDSGDSSDTQGVVSGESSGVGPTQPQKLSASPPVGADTDVGSPDSLIQLEGVRKAPSMYDPYEDAA